MNFAAAILVPLALMVPARGGVEAPSDPAADLVSTQAGEPQDPQTERVDTPPIAAWQRLHIVTYSFEPAPAQQVRIEQRVIIRISPRTDARQQSSVVELPDRAIGPRFVERKIGKCVTASHISGVQTGMGNRLLLFMSDHRIISAMLEKSCRSRDFYSGFYLSKSDDGQLCVSRDTLQSRSGATCKLSQLRQLVEVGD